MKLGARGSRVSAHPASGLHRELGVNKLYSFETWAQQALNFLDAAVGEPAFVICNSVGGRHS